MKKYVALALVATGAILQSPVAAQQTQQSFVRDPKVAIDAEYTQKIKEYTTEPFFNSPLTDYLPASKTVPTPKAVLGDIAGAPGKLPYAEEVYDYMRRLEKASPRVKVYSIGRTEEGREMIAVAIASEQVMARLQENGARLAKLADPRTINMDDAQAETLLNQTTPIYYITGTIHSPETGAPTALMELAYRLAVDESPYIREIRDGVITLITPVVEVDGRDRMVDIYRWHLANPGKRRDKIEVRNTADSLAYTAEKTVRENADKIDDALKSEVEGKIAAVRSQLQSGDADSIRSAMNELSEAMQRIGQAVYGAQQPPEGGPGADGQQPGGEEGRSEEGTVEGEFREV